MGYANNEWYPPPFPTKKYPRSQLEMYKAKAPHKAKDQ